MPPDSKTMVEASMFQSAPDLINRENITWGGSAVANVWFQSAPDLINRENKCRSLQSKGE